MPLNSQNCYPSEFAKLFLLIKINSLCKDQAAINRSFLDQLVQIYNSQSLDSIKVSASEAEIFAQILNTAQTLPEITKEDFENVMEGDALLAASAVWLIHRSKTYLKK